MISRKFTSQARRGFTLTEIAIVLGIMGLILGAIWTAASSVYANQRTSHAQTAILQIAQGVRSLYGSQSSIGTTGIITTNMNNAGVIPSDLNGGATGPFPNGTTGVVATNDSLGFIVVMTAVPRENCINLLAGVGGTNRDPGLFRALAGANAAVDAADGAFNVNAVLRNDVTPVIAAAGPAADADGGAIGGCQAALNKVAFGFTVR